MKHFRIFLAAFALIATTSSFANFNPGIEEPEVGSISYEIQRMLKDSDLIIEENFTVTVFFKVTDEKRIAIQKISSPNEGVNNFLMKRLNDQKLHGKSWYTDKVYELPVKVERGR